MSELILIIISMEIIKKNLISKKIFTNLLKKIETTLKKTDQTAPPNDDPPLSYSQKHNYEEKAVLERFLSSISNDKIYGNDFKKIFEDGILSEFFYKVKNFPKINFMENIIPFF